MYDGKEWSPPRKIDHITDFYTIMADVSCASKTFCAALDTSGKMFTYGPSGWSKPNMLRASLTAVSCVTRVYCIAVTRYREVFTYDGAAWTLTTTLSGSYHLADVSCISESACVAVGERYATVFDGTSWVATRIVAQRPRFVRLSSVSCASADFCVAVDDSGQAYTYDGTGWSKPTKVIPMKPRPSNDAVSCGSVGECVMVATQGRVSLLSGGSWSPPDRIDPHGALTSVSCPSAAFCTAADYYGYALPYRS